MVPCAAYLPKRTEFLPNLFDHDFDAIIIGGGINGLTVAAYLAKTGLKVAVIERRHVVGTHCITEEVSIPGVRHNLHASALVPP